jgi:hypothetical protein
MIPEDTSNGLIYKHKNRKMASQKLKKELRQKVKNSLSKSLSALKGKISPKKLKRNIKKASKVLLAGLKVKSAKKRRKVTAVKKTNETVKTAAQ